MQPGARCPAILWPWGGARRAYRAGAVRRRPVEGARSRGTTGKTAQAECAARQAGWSRQASESSQAGRSRQAARSAAAGSRQGFEACAVGEAQAAESNEAGSEPDTTAEEKPKPRTNLRPVGEQSRPVATDAPNQKKLTCSIFGWRDGRVADFYAVAFGLQGRDWIVERSPRFFWPAGDIPREAHEAHAILVDALLRAGARWVTKARGIGNVSSARSRLRPNSPTAWTGKRSRPRGELPEEVLENPVDAERLTPCRTVETCHRFVPRSGLFVGRPLRGKRLDLLTLGTEDVELVGLLSVTVPAANADRAVRAVQRKLCFLRLSIRADLRRLPPSTAW